MPIFQWCSNSELYFVDVWPIDLIRGIVLEEYSGLRRSCTEKRSRSSQTAVAKNKYAKIHRELRPINLPYEEIF